MIALRYQRSSMAIFGDLARCGPNLAAKNGSAMRLSLIGIVKPASNYTLKANTALQLASGGKTNGGAARCWFKWQEKGSVQSDAGWEFADASNRLRTVRAEI